MADPVLLPSDVEIRVFGTLTSEEARKLSKTLTAATKTGGPWEGPWPAAGFGEPLTLTPSDIVGTHLVAPEEVGILKRALNIGNTPAPTTYLQCFRFLVPCYQVWVHGVGPSPGVAPSPTFNWDGLRRAFAEVLREMDRLELDSSLVVWTVSLAEDSRKVLAAAGRTGVLPPNFFDKVLGGEGEGFRAASWFGPSFVAQHLSEGREHFLVVDTESGSAFRSSELFYLLVGKRFLRQLSTELSAALSSRIPGHADTTIMEEGLDRSNVEQLTRVISLLRERRDSLQEYSFKASNLFERVDAATRFIDFHTLEMVQDDSLQTVADPGTPTIGEVLRRELSIHYRGPIQYFEQAVRGELEVQRHNIDATHQALIDRMGILQQGKLDRLNRIVFLLTIATVGIGGAALVVAILQLLARGV